MENPGAGERWDRPTFAQNLRTLGMSRYHHEHPFHRAMNEGRLTREQLRGWVANRFHYQCQIPVKDAAILSNCPLREVRRRWIHRLSDHDGREGEEGGIEAWLRLGEATGLSRQEMTEERYLLPAVRFAVQSYVTFGQTEPWPIAIASSLTELFAPDLMKERLSAFERFYPWIPATGLDYFRTRLTQARKDSEEGLDLTLEHCNTRSLQERAVQALSFKCDLLWSILDAIALSYGIGREDAPGSVPPSQDRPRLSARARIRKDPVTMKPTLLYPEGAMILNPTAEAIVQLLDGRWTIQEIVQALSVRYHASAETLRNDVSDYLGRLKEKHLVELGA
jgi:pyrroloquinoline-quinone synthase